MAKPFVKWAGGKGKLLRTLDLNLPQNFNDGPITYIEPFVGGGAMLFHMLEAHPNINRAVINDINPYLINCYRLIKDHPQDLINLLRDWQEEFYNLDHEGRKAYFYAKREEYNAGRRNGEIVLDDLYLAADFIFLNRTCFNGLYRENSQGEYNVPFGRYAHPQICNEKGIMKVSAALQNVEILCGNYAHIVQHLLAEERTFVYFDPPYRPLPGTQNFKDYTRWPFNDAEQEALRNFCHILTERGIQWMLSNSDSGDYFDNLYADDQIQRILAPRVINAFAAQRIPQQEVLIKNY